MAEKIADDIENLRTLVTARGWGEVAGHISERMQPHLKEYTASIERQLNALHEAARAQQDVIDTLTTIHTLRSNPAIPANAKIDSLSKRLLDNERINYQIWRACVSANNDEELFYLQNFPGLFPKARIAHDYRALLFHHFTLLQILKEKDEDEGTRMLRAFESAQFPIPPGDQERLRAKLVPSYPAQTSSHLPN